jgi:hypothetical protein
MHPKLFGERNVSADDRVRSVHVCRDQATTSRPFVSEPAAPPTAAIEP